MIIKLLGLTGCRRNCPEDKRRTNAQLRSIKISQPWKKPLFQALMLHDTHID